ncbi:MAG: PAS domain-containing sensor histidine kinase [Gemmatimonadetes bacterium]|nr:PAS domain-containing sensor histidine kinase [Gemmatimonadota bacterium]
MSGWWERIPHDHRIVVLALLAALPGIAISLAFLWMGPYSAGLRWGVTVFLLGGWAGFTYALRARVVRPLQTLSNMLAALREGDFSIRVRGAGSSGALALTYAEANALEEVLREQRLGAVEATALLRKVLEEVDLAVFAFDESETLRLLNRAGEALLGQPSERLIGTPAADLRLQETLSGIAPRTLELNHPGGTGLWELRRTVVRQEGHPLRLIILSDLSRALREEERQAWKRIIRVLSHEINNSLAPIKSIAGSLQSLTRRASLPPDLVEDVESGLKVIAGRAESLGRFMASYAQLARLPEPRLAAVEVKALVRRVVAIETRLEVGVRTGPDVTVQADADQLEQLLINLVRNAVDAALETKGRVDVSWSVTGGRLQVVVADEGPGLPVDTGNLFVPFYTTKPGGSGIGLALCRQIAEGHGGTLTLENSSEGEGARARLTIPVERDGP